MMNNFTPEDLLRYLYHETNAKESEMIRTELESNFSLREQFEELTEAQNLLDQGSLSPSSSVVNRILSYSKDKAPMEETSI